MGLECGGGLAPVLKQTSYSMSKGEYRSIFGGGGDDTVVDFFYAGEDAPAREYTFSSGFCEEDLGEYEDISNVEILTAILLSGGIVTTAIPVALLYLRLINNVYRYLQAALVCACPIPEDTEDPTTPPPSPDPIPPYPTPPPDCCSTRNAQLIALRDGQWENAAALEATFLSQGKELINTTYSSPPSPIPWDYSEGQGEGTLCGFYYGGGTGKEYGIDGLPTSPPSGVNYPILLLRSVCDPNPPPPGGVPLPPPSAPLPPETYDFCESFPALCNVCPEVGNASSVVVSGELTTDCGDREDISYNILFNPS